MTWWEDANSRGEENSAAAVSLFSNRYLPPCVRACQRHLSCCFSTPLCWFVLASYGDIPFVSATSSLHLALPLRIPGMISIQSLVFLTRGNLSLPTPVRPHQTFPLYSSLPPSPQRPPTIPNHTSPSNSPPPQTQSRNDSSRPECL